METSKSAFSVEMFRYESLTFTCTLYLISREPQKYYMVSDTPLITPVRQPEKTHVGGTIKATAEGDRVRFPGGLLRMATACLPELSTQWTGVWSIYLLGATSLWWKIVPSDTSCPALGGDTGPVGFLSLRDYELELGCCQWKETLSLNRAVLEVEERKGDIIGVLEASQGRDQPSRLSGVALPDLLLTDTSWLCLMSTPCSDAHVPLV